MTARKNLRWATIAFWALLLYIIAALVWWLISLEQQNSKLHNLRKEVVTLQNPNPQTYAAPWQAIEKDRRRATVKHVAEGITFFLLILFGAVYIYRLVRRQLKTQQQQQNFVMAVTHELKTPLSVSRLNLETLQKRQLDPPVQQKLVQTALQETLRLDTLINNILLATQLDDSAYVAQKEKVQLHEVAAATTAEFVQRYPARSLETTFEKAELYADAFLIKLLLSNLLENAHKYAPQGTPINCTLKNISDVIVLSVADKGPGIPDEEKKKIFQKFYRIGNESTRSAKGTGLGLFIAQKAAAANSGRLQVHNNEGGGSIFIATFTHRNTA